MSPISLSYRKSLLILLPCTSSVYSQHKSQSNSVEVWLRSCLSTMQNHPKAPPPHSEAKPLTTACKALWTQALWLPSPSHRPSCSSPNMPNILLSLRPMFPLQRRLFPRTSVAFSLIFVRSKAEGRGKREEEGGSEFWDGNVFDNQDVLEEEKSEIRLAGFGHAEVEVSEEHWWYLLLRDTIWTSGERTQLEIRIWAFPCREDS